MQPIKPLSTLSSHQVTNMPPYIGDQDLWGADAALREGVLREGGGWASDHLTSFGATTGSVENFDKGEQANKHHPEL